MYRIKRTYQTAKKQPWLVDLLVNISPSYFSPQANKEDCQRELRVLGDDIRAQRVRWKRGLFNLSRIRDIIESEDEIVISYKNGKQCVSFKIEEYKTENYDKSRQ